MYSIETVSERTTDFVTNVLDIEHIPYKLKPIKVQNYFNPFMSTVIGYNIELHTDFNHFEYVSRILFNELGKLDKIYTIPENTLTIPKNEVKTFTVPQVEIKQYKPKKSILKKLMDLLIKNRGK